MTMEKGVVYIEVIHVRIGPGTNWARAIPFFIAWLETGEYGVIDGQ